MFSNDSEFISVHVRGKCLTRFFTVSLHLQFVNSAVFYLHTIIQLHATLKTHQSKKLQLIYFASAVVNNAKLPWTH